MNDQDRFQQLIQAKHPCICMLTHEEDYALGIVRDTAIKTGMVDVVLWSVIGGVRDGLVAGIQGVPETEHPAAGLYHLMQRDLNPDSYSIVLDLVPHLK